MLWSVCAAEAKASGDERVSARADSLLAAGRFAEAALEYERAVFSGRTAEAKAQALLQKGRCQKLAGNYAEALRSLKRSDTLAVSERLAYHLRYETALCAYLAENPVEADFQLLQIKRLSDPSWQDSCLLLQILVDLEQERWSESRERIIRYAQQENISIDTLQLADEEKDLGLKSRTKARRLSKVVPGLGQVYAGKPWRGLSSFLLTTGAAAYGVVTVLQGYYITGSLSGLGLTYRFYSGGVRYAGRLAEVHNARAKEAYAGKVRSLLLPAEK